MKYIRTKDGVYEINWFDADNFGDEKGDMHSNCEIISEANTIEELCDEFVIVWKEYEYKHCLWEDLQELELAYKDWQFDEMENIYGAIWTDKGLIYVAKMNDKGELELL